MARRKQQQSSQQQQQPQQQQGPSFPQPQQPPPGMVMMTPQQQQYHQMMMQALKSNVPNLDPMETKKWHTIYPQYINSNLTVDRGRRLARSKCVADPLAEEIFNVLAANSQHFHVQLNMYKCYNRELDKENIRTRGYVKYRLVNENDEQFKNKRRVLQYVASMIPKLKSRQNPPPKSQQTQQSGGGNVQVEQPQQHGGGGGGGKKKNRRK